MIGMALSRLRGLGLGSSRVSKLVGLGSWVGEGGGGSGSESPFSEPSGVQWQVPSKYWGAQIGHSNNEM